MPSLWRQKYNTGKKNYNPVLNPLESRCYKNQGHSAMNWTIFISALCRVSGSAILSVFSEALWQWFHYSPSASVIREAQSALWVLSPTAMWSSDVVMILHLSVSVYVPKLSCRVDTTLFNSWTAQINSIIIYCGFPLNEGQHSGFRGHDSRLRWGLYWHINGMGVRGELGLTQSLVSELITTSLWAKNSKGFLAYHRFNYRGGEEKGHHTAFWLHGRKRHRLGQNTGSLQGI